ncbi:peroxidase 2-like [Hordeum vulgare subsp. vulgare]|uniref:peroxidase n=1 Tax=Hordeum vulgare subsp. vulgare TaxID=112509 RepID=A0A8I6WLD6_HORVV|nr:peroxidase 2-like [Hordeum vulgare subsp. vulgare]
MPKLAAALALLALLGSVACQGDNGSPAVSPAYSPSSGPASPGTISYPPAASPSKTIPSPIVLSPSPSPLARPPSLDLGSPSQSPLVYPPSVSQPAFPPSGSSRAPSASSPEYLPSPSQSVSSQTPSTHSPDPSPPTNSPASSPSPMSPSTIAYPPSPSPSQPTYPPSPSPAAYTPSPSPINPRQPDPPSPSPSPASYISSPSPSPSPDSPGPAAYPPFSNSPSNSPSPSSPVSGLSVGHYSYSCPNAEAIVREAVKNATDKNRGTGAGLIRLFFHDCFVRGCDASVLLNTTGSDEPTELKGQPNKTLRGFEVIDAAKAALEAACPGVVSCADVLAFAGRDASFFLTNGTAYFPMPAGRYDGRVSFSKETTLNLPAPFSTLKDLNESFHAKGLSLEEMVILSGAHSVGRSSCSSFYDRLPANSSDMDPEFASSLRKQCSSNDPTAMQDFKTPDDLDRQYYQNVVNHRVLFGSDAALMGSNETARMVLDNAYVSGLWERKFAAAMVKMGGVGVKTRADGEIRKKCWIIN